MRKKAAVVVALGFFTCRLWADPAADQVRLVAANNGFAFDLLKPIITEQPRANVFLSPFSVSSALQMTANGAAGDTRAEMQKILKTGDLPPEALSASCRDLDQSLNSQTNVILNLANAIWYQDGLHLKPGFVATNSRFFHAELAPVDFQKPDSAKTINDWASDRTRGKIRDIVQWPFPPLTRVILANAIYFKGKWARPFDNSATRPRAFHLASGGTKPASLMTQRGRFSYQEGEGFQAVQLPYAGGRLRMDLFLPDTNSTLARFLFTLTADTWRDKIMPRFHDREGALAFPRFKLEYDVTLNDALETLGMRHAFEDADFSEMANERLFISKVKQKSYADVNEEGTEAAAVTTVAMHAMAIMEPLKPFEMTVDRPFFFVIEDSETGSILFLGLVYDPAGAGD
jgi:serine protease inhibitor